MVPRSTTPGHGPSPRFDSGNRAKRFLISYFAQLGVSAHAGDKPGCRVESSMGALIKVGQLLSPPLQRRVESIATAVDAPSSVNEPVALATLTTLARASRDSERVRFAYRRANGEASVRHVEPHHVVPLNRRWYLIAWDLDRDDWRNFRLDRIDDANATNRRFTPRPLPGDDPANFLRETITALRSVHNVVLIVDTPIEAVERHLGPWGSAISVNEGTTRIEMNIPDFGWAVLMLAILDAEIRHVEPPEFRRFLHGLSRRFLALAAPDSAEAQPTPKRDLAT